MFYRNLISIQAHAFGPDGKEIKDLENDALLKDQPVNCDGKIHIYVNCLFDIYQKNDVKTNFHRKLIR